MKITKRDLKFFFLGMLSLLLFEFIFDWSNTVSDFIEGFNEGYNRVLK
jgi:hypothetical protein